MLRLINDLIVVLIFISIAMIILQSVDSINHRYEHVFRWIEILIVIIFTIEYLMRVYVSNYYRQGHFWPRIQFALSPMAIVDLLSILPFFIPFIIPLDLRFLRILRLSRIFRVLKLNRLTHALKTIRNAVKKKKDELVTSLILMGLVLLVASILMYYAENSTQPESSAAHF